MWLRRRRVFKEWYETRKRRINRTLVTMLRIVTFETRMSSMFVDESLTLQWVDARLLLKESREPNEARLAFSPPRQRLRPGRVVVTLM
jgi:hypothetical protein